MSNCTILNQTAESLHVECIEGFDGGLQQEFIMEVYDTQTRKLVSNVTSRNPIFTVGGLESGLGFDIGLYAANKKGKSDVVNLQAFTLKSAEKHTGKTRDMSSFDEIYSFFIKGSPTELSWDDTW